MNNKIGGIKINKRYWQCVYNEFDCVLKVFSRLMHIRRLYIFFNNGYSILVALVLLAPFILGFITLKEEPSKNVLTP